MLSIPRAEAKWAQSSSANSGQQQASNDANQAAISSGLIQRALATAKALSEEITGRALTTEDTTPNSSIAPCGNSTPATNAITKLKTTVVPSYTKTQPTPMKTTTPSSNGMTSINRSTPSRKPVHRKSSDRQSTNNEPHTANTPSLPHLKITQKLVPLSELKLPTDFGLTIHDGSDNQAKSDIRFMMRRVRSQYVNGSIPMELYTKESFRKDGSLQPVYLEALDQSIGRALYNCAKLKLEFETKGIDKQVQESVRRNNCFARLHRSRANRNKQLNSINFTKTWHSRPNSSYSNTALLKAKTKRKRLLQYIDYTRNFMQFVDQRELLQDEIRRREWYPQMDRELATHLSDLCSGKPIRPPRLIERCLRTPENDDGTRVRKSVCWADDFKEPLEEIFYTREEGDVIPHHLLEGSTLYTYYWFTTNSVDVDDVADITRTWGSCHPYTELARSEYAFQSDWDAQVTKDKIRLCGMRSD